MISVLWEKLNFIDGWWTGRDENVFTKFIWTIKTWWNSKWWLKELWMDVVRWMRQGHCHNGEEALLTSLQVSFGSTPQTTLRCDHYYGNTASTMSRMSKHFWVTSEGASNISLQVKINIISSCKTNHESIWVTQLSTHRPAARMIWHGSSKCIWLWDIYLALHRFRSVCGQ